MFKTIISMIFTVFEKIGLVEEEVKTSSKTIRSEIIDIWDDPEEMKKFEKFSKDLEKEVNRLTIQTKSSEEAMKKLDEFNRRALGEIK